MRRCQQPGPGGSLALAEPPDSDSDSEPSKQLPVKLWLPVTVLSDAARAQELESGSESAASEQARRDLKPVPS